MPWDKFSGGNSSFAAQFMRTTVAKIKGRGIPNAITLPHLFTWPEGSTHPASDPTNWSITDASGAGTTTANLSNVAAATENDWNPYSGGAAPGVPPALSNRQIQWTGTVGDKVIGFGYRGWYNEGLQFDLSRGLRVQTMSGHNGSTWRNYASPRLYSLVDGVIEAWVNVDYNFGGAPAGNTFTVYTGAGGVAAASQVSAGYGVGQDRSWQTSNIEIPAGGVGNATIGATIFHASSGYRLTASEEFVLPEGLASSPINCVGFGRFWRSGSYGGQVRLNYIWVGTASDDWPV